MRMIDVKMLIARYCIPSEYYGGKMMQNYSVGRQLFAFIRSGVAGLAGNWKPLAIVAIIWWPSVVLANESDGFSPHLILVVDESGSMRGRHGWLADAIPALGLHSMIAT